MNTTILPEPTYATAIRDVITSAMLRQNVSFADVERWGEVSNFEALLARPGDFTFHELLSLGDLLKVNVFEDAGARIRLNRE